MGKTKQEIFGIILDECNIEDLFTATLNRVMANVKEPTSGLRHTNMSKIREILSDAVGDTGNYLEFDGNDIDFFIMSPLYRTDLYLIVGHDVDLTKYPHLNQPNAFTMWKQVRHELDEDWECEISLNAIIVIGEASPYISKDNILHIIKHEIVHYILAHLELRGILNLSEIDKEHGLKFTEFLCDFLPFYILDGVDWICNSSHFRGLEVQNKCVKSFLEYIANNFDDDVQDEYISYLDELNGVLTQNLAPF